MGKGIIVSGRTGVICVMLWAAVLPLRPLCAAEDNAGSGMCVELYENVVPEDGIVTEGYCGPTGREKSVRWRIEGDTLRLWSDGELKEKDNVAYYEKEYAAVVHMQDCCRRMGVHNLVVEEGTTSIGGHILSFLGEIRSVKLPKSLRRIDNAAFWACGFEEIILPDSLEEIGRNAFAWCEYVKHITIPESVVKIGKGAFAGMCALESADVRVPWIEWRRYGKAMMLIDKRRDELLLCTGVEYVKIPREVKSIGEYAFAGNKELKRVKFHNGLECVGEGAFSNCTGLEDVTVAGVEELGGVFYECDNLRKVKLNRGLKKLEGTFYACQSLQEVNFLPEGLMEIGESTFSNCWNVKRVTVPDSVRIIGDKAFAYCKALEDVKFGKHLDTIGEEAFAECSSLRRIDLPENIKVVDDRAFYKCTNMQEVRSEAEHIDFISVVFGQCERLKRVILPNSGVSGLSFLGCDSIEVIDIGGELDDDGVGTYDGVYYMQNIRRIPKVACVYLLSGGKRGVWRMPENWWVEMSYYELLKAVRQFDSIVCPGEHMPILYDYNPYYGDHERFKEALHDGRADGKSCVLVVRKEMREKLLQKRKEDEADIWSMFDEIVELKDE